MARRHQFIGQPVEISIFGGLLKFTAGQPWDAGNLSLPHHRPSLLPCGKDRHAHTDIICQLQELSELKRTGAIDADEFNLLKGVVIEASASPLLLDQKDGEMLTGTLEDQTLQLHHRVNRKRRRQFLNTDSVL